MRPGRRPVSHSLTGSSSKVVNRGTPVLESKALELHRDGLRRVVLAEESEELSPLTSSSPLRPTSSGARAWSSVVQGVRNSAISSSVYRGVMCCGQFQSKAATWNTTTRSMRAE